VKHCKIQWRNLLQSMEQSTRLTPRNCPRKSAEENKENLLATTVEIMTSLLVSVDTAPAELRQVCQLIIERVALKFPENTRLAFSAFLFLRIYCSSLTSPELKGITKKKVGKDAKRAFILACKILQNLSTGAEFGKKESFMQPFNTFLESNKEWLNQYLDRLVAISSDSADTIKLATRSEEPKAIERIQDLLQTHWAALKKQYGGSQWFAEFQAAVFARGPTADTELLSLGASQNIPSTGEHYESVDAVRSAITQKASTS